MRVTQRTNPDFRLFAGLLGMMALGMSACYFGLWLPLVAQVWPP